MKQLSMFAIALLFFTHPSQVLADSGVDKVYHPYVMPFEREFEWRFTSRQNDDGNVLLQRIAYGHALSEFLTLETYLVGERDDQGNFGIAAYELESRWMVTEQGEHWADWGMLFEIEKEHEESIWEASSGVLMEKEFGRTSLTTNVFVVYRFGSKIDNALSSEFRVKYRYRWMPEIQPAIEFYTSKDFTGIGPAFMGIKRFEGQRQLKWELGFIAGLNGDSKDHTLRFALEMEF